MIDPPAMTDLKLIALDEVDLGILSAHLQDAVMRGEDMAYLPRERRFAALLNRFDWSAAHAVRRRGTQNQRRRTAIRIERVRSARLQGIDPKAKDRILVLLAINFEAGTAPGGAIKLVFAGGAAIWLEVDCIEAELRDLGAAWSAKSRPDHGRDDGSTEAV